jgi:hypothetical protein
LFHIFKLKFTKKRSLLEKQIEVKMEELFWVMPVAVVSFSVLAILVKRVLGNLWSFKWKTSYNHFSLVPKKTTPEARPNYPNPHHISTITHGRTTNSSSLYEVTSVPAHQSASRSLPHSSITFPGSFTTTASSHHDPPPSYIEAVGSQEAPSRFSATISS